METGKKTLGAEIVYVTGGARSGKSRWAVNYASGRSGKRLFVATAEVEKNGTPDEEMLRRIEKHRAERGSGWDLEEEAIDLAQVIKRNREYDVILVDCLTLWVSNLLLSNENHDIERHFEALTNSLEQAGAGEKIPSKACCRQRKSEPKHTIILVSNEVGMGIVPVNALARDFRDKAGILNQRVAEVADRAILLVSGLAVQLKGE